ncbi:MAG: fused MFS/spermidine synthase [Xanthomonadales bacterium]|nr:fused MFS/spermidine synthase [Xanthomonadales bacterium]
MSIPSGRAAGNGALPDRPLLALFALSGAAALVYQALWSHYLGLVLGHAAHAQVLVLALFMGGMALGAWLAGRRGARWRRPLRAYALAEGVIGVAGLGFHGVFVGLDALGQAVLPALDSTLAVRAWQWGGAAALIAPQCVLLGMTFPLLGAAWLRLAPTRDTAVLAGLYFGNGLGAAVGALAAAFVLLPWLGLPGSVAVAGLVNLVVAVWAWRLAGRWDVGDGDGAALAGRPSPPAPPPQAGEGRSGVPSPIGGEDSDVGLENAWPDRPVVSSAAVERRWEIGAGDGAALAGRPSPPAPPPQAGEGRSGVPSPVGVAVGRHEAPSQGGAASGSDAVRARSAGVGWLAAVAALTAVASFVYEIAWVRLLNQALGTTLHAFELMLASFVGGLALGGWWLRRRAHRVRDALAWAGWAQVAMAAAALASLPVFARSFDWVGLLVRWLPANEAGYALFLAGSAAIALAVMLPAAFCAGLVLPLLTSAALRAGAGEGGIGRIYAANTLGAVAGVALTVAVLVPWLGLAGAVIAAALLDAALGIALLRAAPSGLSGRQVLALAGVLALALLLALGPGRPDPRALASGVFRHGHARLDAAVTVDFIEDGRTATVALYRQGSVATVATNGKPDAALQLDPDGTPTGDEPTMLLLGALPLLVHPAPAQVAVVGWGAGLSTHTLLGSPRPVQVATVEIEAAMVRAARGFGQRVARAYDDPRSVTHIDDARTFFSAARQGWDVIVSEPSNPWVSGVAALFTRQFHALLARHLAEHGVLVQWLHTYELDDALLATMVAALLEVFAHVEVYVAHSSDLILLASKQPLSAPDFARLDSAVLHAELARVGLAGTADIALRRLGDARLLHGLVAAAGAVPHSDFHPVVALQAPRARFTGAHVELLPALAATGLPVLELTAGRQPVGLAATPAWDPDSQGVVNHWQARDVRSGMLAGHDVAQRRAHGTVDPPADVAVDDGAPLRLRLPARHDDRQPLVLGQVHVLKGGWPDPGQPDALPRWLEALAVIGEYTLGHLPAADLEPLWQAPVWLPAGEAPPQVAAVLAAYAAIAARDLPAMRPRADAALQALDAAMPADNDSSAAPAALARRDGGAEPLAVLQGDAEVASRTEAGPAVGGASGGPVPTVPALLREHLQQAAILAALALGDRADARQRLERLDALAPPSHEYAMVRRYLHALATLP